MFKFYNPNPEKLLVGDCVVRAISKITGQDWEKTYIDICLEGFEQHDMPSANHVWESYLIRLGFTRRLLPDTCLMCYTVRDFCEDFPTGEYILSTGEHVIAVLDGDYYDTWDSGDELPRYYWIRY